MKSNGGALACILAFNGNCQLAVRRAGGRLDLPFAGADLAAALAELEKAFPEHTSPVERFAAAGVGSAYRVFLVQVRGAAPGPEIAFEALAELEGHAAALSPALAAVIAGLGPHLVEIPYLALGENDYIYKFRPEKERNHAIYSQDPDAAELYQSRLFTDIKTLARRHERLAADPVTLDF
ncbi:MAG TPA: hypothetical protein VFE31_00225, partial [Opitutaceae bacterium]|nr:hypothetical protein [Opitutaceae bacterium]